jgi:hypothetical protein
MPVSASAPGEASVVEHPSQVELLDHDRPVLTREPSGQFVKCVLTYVRDAGIHPGSLAPGPRSSFGVRLAAGNCPVESPQLRELLIQGPRIRNE